MADTEYRAEPHRTDPVVSACRALATLLSLFVGFGLVRVPVAKADDRSALQTFADHVRLCGTVADDGDRLRCYDDTGARAASAAPDAIMLLGDAKAVAPSDLVQQPDGRSGRSRHPIRIELGYGVAIGDYAGSAKISPQGTLEINSATGGSGGGFMAEAWLDDWPHKDFSIGLEYLEINNRGELSATLPHGVSILTDPIYAHLALAVQADALMVNFAYRPAGAGWMWPVAGFGLGVGYGTATVDGLLSNSFVGAHSGLSDASSAFPAIQGFAGVEARISNRLYFSVIPRIFVVSARPFGINESYTDFILGTNLGYRFR